jgi:hypothetical protein
MLNFSGLFSTQRFEKDDIVADYNGQVVTGVNIDDYVRRPGVLSEYVMEVVGPPRRIIDGSEPNNHIGKLRLGRLINHVTQKKKNAEANLKPVEIALDACEGQRIVVFKARRPIEILEHLRYDYQDKTAQVSFAD